MKKTEMNVLIIEDETSLRTALTEVVKRKGYRAVPVAKPDEALSIAKIKPIHALIVDVMLPGKNGVDVVMALKENLMDGTPIVFISGIYRDKQFAQDTVKKTGAIDYFLKPFNNDALIDVLEKNLKRLIEVPKVDLHSLLSQPFASSRERRKSLDYVDELSGHDLPFVFCILMDDGATGHLNIIDEEQNIYGVTLCKGSLQKVDAEATALQVKKLLIQNQYITELELSELKTTGSGSDLVKLLVEQGLMSPHIQSIIKQQTITTELNKLVSSKKLKINFVPDRKLAEESDNIDMASFLPQLHDMIDTHLPIEWLQKFYTLWSGHPVGLGPQFSDITTVAQTDIIKRVDGLVDLFKQQMTIEEILALNKFKEFDFYKALHLLMLRKLIVFEEVKKIKNVDEHINRLKSMHAALLDKNPLEIFAYFGLGDNPKPAEVVRVYKEFAKSNHPDTLPSSVGAEVKKLNGDLFSHVTAAYEMLSNEEKKQTFFNSIKQAEAERQIKSDELVTAAAQSLSRGRYTEALPLLKSAEKLYSSERSRLHMYWARFKIEGQINEGDLSGIDKDIKAMAGGTRKTALWIFVNGLIKRFTKDYPAALDSFQRVLQEDTGFMDARREIAFVKSKTEKKDFMNADISTVLKDILNRKKGA
jgi:CheY-like chemotaxis protein